MTSFIVYDYYKLNAPWNRICRFIDATITSRTVQPSLVDEKGRVNARSAECAVVS